jgi:hypothetical protein
MWRIALGRYKCPQCEEDMVSLLNEVDEIPLFCPYCFRPNSAKKLTTYIRNIAPNDISLLEELQRYLL